MSSDDEIEITNWNAVNGVYTGEAVDLVSEFYGISPSDAEDLVNAAIETGELIEDDSGTFTKLRVPGIDTTEDETTETTLHEDAEDARECLNEILEYYHDKIDEEINHAKPDYSTPREYYREARGWTDETIDAKRLGYAPPNHEPELLNRLLIAGYDRETILSTGLFGERENGSLYAVWTGRFVLPYAKKDGDILFAISRASTPPHERDWAGRYGEDDDPAKYHKIPSTRSEVLVEEPIYGLDTVEPGEPVLITEGIADAITAHQNGYACISPVTTQFSNDDMDRLADVLDEHSIDQAFIVQDAEKPSSSVVETPDGDERLHIDQFGPGVKGAVKTASRLVVDGIDARVGELPRLGLDKVDLDDYLTRWDGDLNAVIRSAKPPAQHPALEQVRPSIDEAREHIAPKVESTSGTSALWEIDITDVTGRAVGSRGKNPLGHHGDSENYFVVIDDQVAYDHKHKAAYNALTHLLCDAGARHADSPGGSLTDEDVWIAWRHAKDQGYISSDDKCPSAALRHVALKHSVCGPGDVNGWKLPRDAYEATLDVIEKEYGIEHGHEVGQRVSTLPIARIQALSWDEARWVAKKRGFDWPSTRQARERLENTVVRTVERQDHMVIDAPTALGKSYTVSTFPWLRHRDVTGAAPVVHVHATREARDEALASSVKNGVKAKAVLGRKEACPVAAGDFDGDITMNGEPASEWMDRQCDGKGIPVSVAHALLAENNDQETELPCSPGEVECPSKIQWTDVPWYNPGSENAGPDGCGGVEGFEEEYVKYDVVHATHPMLFVPSMTKGTNVVIDELPDYALRVEDGDRDGGISMDRIQNAVTGYLQAIDAPVSTWESFVILARSRGEEKFEDLYGSLAEQYFELLEAVEERSPPLDWYVDTPDAHVLSRAVIECIINAFEADVDRNGLRHGTTVHTLPRMDSEDARVRVSLVIDDDNRVQTIRQTPDLSRARSVVGLDAHPAMPLWQLNSTEYIDRTEILDTDERRFWRLFERGLFAVQVGEATRPLSGDNALEWFSEEKLDVLLGELVDEGLRTGITTTQVEGELASLLEENGVIDPKTMHYGEVRSRNDFGDEDVGFVNGCMDPGDDFVLTVLSEYGCDAEPEITVDDDGEEHRAHGRGFEGPDADIADAILASVRENEVAQAAGRYARNADDPDDRAVVYVRTDATPTGFADVQVCLLPITQRLRENSTDLGLRTVI